MIGGQVSLGFFFLLTASLIGNFTLLVGLALLCEWPVSGHHVQNKDVKICRGVGEFPVCFSIDKMNIASS